MQTKLMKIIIALLFLFFVSCSQVNDRNSDMEKIGPDVPASLVIYFKVGTTDKQIEDFIQNVLSVPDPDGQGHYHKEGIAMILRVLSTVESHEAIALTFTDDATNEERQNLKQSIQSDEMVYRVLENIAPKDVKNLEENSRIR